MLESGEKAGTKSLPEKSRLPRNIFSERGATRLDYTCTTYKSIEDFLTDITAHLELLVLLQDRSRRSSSEKKV